MAFKRYYLPIQSSSMSRHDQGWLPSSTQLFATIVVATVLTVVFSFATTPASASQVTPERSSTQLVGQSNVFFAIGRLVDCKLPDSVSLNVLTSTAKAVVTGGDTKDAAILHSGTASISVGCSLQLTNSDERNSQQNSLQAGPFDPQQELQLSGIDALDCLVHGGQLFNRVDQTPYVFLLRGAGPDAQDGMSQFEAVEYAQLPQASGSSTHALLESWLGTSLPESCLAALNSYSNTDSNSDSDSEDGTDATADADALKGLSRQLLQTETPPPSPAPANASTAAAANSTDATAAQVPPTAPVAGPDNAPAAGPAPAQTNNIADSSSSTNSTTPEVQLLPDAANSTITTAANNSALNGTLSEDAVRVVCALQPETGPCRAALPRWAFDIATSACKPFVYGGCDGNANNFASREACDAACAVVMGPAPVQEPEVVPTGPVATTVDAPRVLAGEAPAPASSRAHSSRMTDRSWGEQLLRVVLAGLVGLLTVCLV